MKSWIIGIIFFILLVVSPSLRYLLKRKLKKERERDDKDE